MKSSVTLARKAVLLLLLTGIIFSATSCAVTAQPSQRSTTVQKKKAHPHGGPPGQTKKPAGHPGKRH